MRVIAGTARSLPLKTPEGMATRPTTDRIKETLFNMINPYLSEAVFIDLFSGSGSIGIEALSRGARKAYFVDFDAKAVKCIQDNLKFTRMSERAIVLKQEAADALLQFHDSQADIIFMDPPYDHEWEKKILMLLKDKPYITEDTLIIVEASLNTDFSYLVETGFTIQKQKKYKTNQHLFIKRRF